MNCDPRVCNEAGYPPPGVATNTRIRNTSQFLSSLFVSFHTRFVRMPRSVHIEATVRPLTTVEGALFHPAICVHNNVVS